MIVSRRDVFRLTGLGAAGWVLTACGGGSAAPAPAAGGGSLGEVSVQLSWIKNIEFGGAKAELSVWGRNLTDRNYENSNLFLPTGTAINYMPARTYGVELGIQF